MEHWNEEHIPNQSDRQVIVTGANTGIGFETARIMANKGANVILACRNSEKGELAVRRILDQDSVAKVQFSRLDLADLDSVRDFSDKFLVENKRLDLLINNAGVMMPPESKTKQGFELQFGVNHLGHFALTIQLLPLIIATRKSRVVCVSSQAHRGGSIVFNDLNFKKRRYAPWSAYSQSKLANLLFVLALQKLLTGTTTIAVAAHPGWTGTDLQRTFTFARLMNPFFAMSATQGALPTLRAAVDQNVKGEDYYGPHGFAEMRGFPIKVMTSLAARNQEDAKRLWTASEALTGVSFSETAPV